MRVQALGIALLGLAGLGASASCGGRTPMLGPDLGDGGDDALQSPTGSSGGPPMMDNGSSSGGSSGYSSSGSCGPDVRSFGAQSSLACWGCLAKGCPDQLSLCAQDCACNEMVVQALRCVNGGGTPLDCFMSALVGSNTDPASSAFGSCLISAGTSCACGMTPVDASPPGCVETGVGGTGASGQCSATLQETCGGASYQVVCSCPRGKCVCFGDSTTVISYGGCPYCPGGPITAPGTPSNAELYAACGFPR